MKALLLVILQLTYLFIRAQSMYYDFGTDNHEKGYRAVTISDRYSADKGFGLTPTAPLKVLSAHGDNLLINDGITAELPFYFEADLPEGNYFITVILGDQNEATNTTIKAESRRLMLQNIQTRPGEWVRETFVVNVRTPRINETDSVRRKPRELSYLNWDHKLTLEFNGSKPVVRGVEIIPAQQVITVFLAGNSTVTDQENEPWASWGQMIPRFFNEEVVIANLAESGESLKSFRRERRLDKVRSLMKPGDYLFIEFAHNDQKPGGNHVEPFTTYQEELRYFAKVAREKGVQPVFVTSMHRRKFDSEGMIVNTLEDYPEAMRQLAAEEEIPLIDLNAMSKAFYEAMGEEGSKKVFVHFAANTYANQPEALADNTHFSNYGAYQLARLVVEGIRTNLPDLSSHLRVGLPSYDPSRPEYWADWHFYESPASNPTKPDGN